MAISERFKSRKFWITLVSTVTIAISQAFEIELEPATIASLAAIIAAWVLGESKIDSEAVKVGASTYVKALEAELQKVLIKNAQYEMVIDEALPPDFADGDPGPIGMTAEGGSLFDR